MRNDSTDPIIAEVRAVRHVHAARFDFNISAIFQNIREMQEISERTYLRYPARPVTASGAEHAQGREAVDPGAKDSA